MGEYTMPFELFHEEWTAIKLRNPSCSANILTLVIAVIKEEPDLEDITGDCLDEGLSQDFVDTVIIAAQEPESHKEYLDLVLKGK